MLPNQFPSDSKRLLSVKRSSFCVFALVKKEKQLGLSEIRFGLVSCPQFFPQELYYDKKVLKYFSLRHGHFSLPHNSPHFLYFSQPIISSG